MQQSCTKLGEYCCYDGNLAIIFSLDKRKIFSAAFVFADEEPAVSASLLDKAKAPAFVHKARAGSQVSESVHVVFLFRTIEMH